jgi:hypothetical protein
VPEPTALIRSTPDRRISIVAINAFEPRWRPTASWYAQVEPEVLEMINPALLTSAAARPTSPAQTTRTATINNQGVSDPAAATSTTVFASTRWRSDERPGATGRDPLRRTFLTFADYCRPPSSVG